MPSRAKYKRITDLYVEGTEYVLRDGTVLWLQALNPFEADEARHDAQTAKARLTLALHEDDDSDELAKLNSRFRVDGREDVIETVVESALEVGETMLKIVNALQDDPEWAERLEITEREDAILAKPPEDPEHKLLTKINEEYLAEVRQRMDAERDYQRRQAEALSDDQLFDRYRELYIERRGNTVAMAEWRLTELWYAARVCDGTQAEDGTWDHSQCDSHRTRVWETKTEVRDLPEQLQEGLFDAMSELNMAVREAKGSGRPEDSSTSSSQPSEEAESTPSTQGETPEPAPGTSTPQSATPSPS